MTFLGHLALNALFVAVMSALGTFLALRYQDRVVAWIDRVLGSARRSFELVLVSAAAVVLLVYAAADSRFDSPVLRFIVILGLLVSGSGVALGLTGIGRWVVAVVRANRRVE
jgi:hypothetical protein